MKLTLSFIFVAITLLQMTAASPVAKGVDKRDIKKFAYLVAEDPSDPKDTVAEGVSDAQDVEKRA
ncbi:hypothetical protein BDR04DRAFT_1093352 [Suillus decipiens]|nr:hypothetical protein BDR04DRAFT_1093352 [Suillus decipiens]